MLEGLYKRRKTSRFDVLFYIVAGIFIVLALRLFMLQILAGGYYQAKAEGNRLRMVPMTAARGVMYDRNGQILVGSRPAYTISIMPTGKALDDGEVAKLVLRGNLRCCYWSIFYLSYTIANGCFAQRSS